ncbi:MAG: prepilin-type N-terminal cleavage/methylation domain-containing protein, partial [bacterium]|nr:prepilin-type N-terminal cleavage/methylation domain-containing protein [bacterium]
MLKNAGFTLIELLIVIVIIAILAVVGITLFNNVQSSAHDARRKADIQAIAQAMEAHYNPTSGAYPTALDATWFADGAIPTDPDGEPYPIIVGIDPDGSTPVNGFIVCTSSEVGSSCSESSQIKYDGPPIIISATPT